jgi:hypothetical protein
MRFAVALAVSAAVLIFVAAPSAGISAVRHFGAVKPQVATHRLDLSGAVISIREEFPDGWPIAQRTLLLRTASGRTREVRLQPGGGTAGNQSLNLFKVADDQYLIASEKDCVEFAPVGGTVRNCRVRPPCRDGNLIGPTFLGRFDWMNGYDPPKGDFGLGFRFLGFEDAAESQACSSGAH